MNKQDKGNGKRGVEWTDFTSGPIGGCFHDCTWDMPDKAIANCYAEDIAEGLAQSSYPHGFKHHYWRPEEIQEWQKLKTPSKIFVGSMADVFGRWVTDEQINAILDGCRRAHWHTFQFLTKNAPRLEKFHYPPNVWVGVSAPPSSFMGKRLNEDQQARMVYRQRTALLGAKANGAKVAWMSIEPLSFDIAPLLTADLDWAVIGAASNGAKVYQPEPQWVLNVLKVLKGKPVFFKGNLSGNPAAHPWREEFPVTEKMTQLSLFRP